MPGQGEARTRQSWGAGLGMSASVAQGRGGAASGGALIGLSSRPMPDAILQIAGVSKTYASGLPALQDVQLEIRRGEIFALLGPNGAGKTTLISIVCGIVNATAGRVSVDGHDIARDF